MGREDKTQRRVLRAASRLLAKKGVRGLTVREIAKAAKQSTMSIYSRFGGKDGVIDALYQEGFSLLAQRQQKALESGAPLEQLINMCQEYRDVALNHRAHYKLMFSLESQGRSPSSQQVSSATFEALVGAVDACIKTGALDPADPAEVAHALFAFCHGLVDVELAGLAPPRSSERYRAALSRLLAGFGAGKA